MKLANIFESIPAHLTNEVFEGIIKSPNLRIERIISKGQSTPEGTWYDQDEHEWVMLLEGEALLWFDDGSSARLNKGDYINIPAHCKHKVAWTSQEQITIWLAIFYK
jgi:cupin 2 domain-containing protein